MKRYFYILFVLALLLSACGEKYTSDAVFETYKDMISEVKSDVEQVPYKKFKEKLEKNEFRVLIDVREPTEFEEGFINQPNEDDEYPYPETFTVNIPRGILELHINDKDYWDNELWVEMPSKDEEIILYCSNGERSALVAYSMKLLGFKNVKILRGGYRIWLDPTTPLEEAPKKSGGCG